MSARLPSFFTLYLIVLLSCVFPAAGISVSCSSGGGGESVSSSDTFDLDDSTSLQERISFDFGSISKYRDASGSGNNSVDEYISGTDFSLQNSVQSAGSFGLSSSASATAQSGSLAQDVAGTGSMSISLSSAQGSEQANQGASVTYGALDSVQSLTAGQGVSASQSTGMVGLEGSLLSGAVGSENVMGATGTFAGAGLMHATLAASTSAETGRASATGTADLDGTTLIDGSSFQAVSSQSLEMGLEGLRDVGDGDIGGFDVNVLNLEKPEMESTAALTSTSAASTAGGSYSSYVLTGYRWNQANPQIQLYLNPSNAPSGITASETQSAVSAAANTWDDEVSSNLFADGTTVIIDNSKSVDNPFSSTPVSDKSNVVGWASMGSSYLGMTRWWSNGATKEGYKSILEADTWLASDKKWTTDLSKATGSTYDIQSVAVHELGHTIGLGDLYTLPSTDSRKYDWNQVMNSYDGAQRVLGNGDTSGVKSLYGYMTGLGSYLSGDFNGDGMTDLIHILGDKDNPAVDYIDLLISRGDGTFDLQSFSPRPGYWTGSGSFVSGDFNGDGKSDLVHILGDKNYPAVDYVNIWISQGDGTFDLQSFSPRPGYWTGSGNFVSGDINGDGKSDLVHVLGDKSYPAVDFVNIWTSNGDESFDIGSFSPSTGYKTGLGSFKSGDFDGDGQTDMMHILGDKSNPAVNYVDLWTSEGEKSFDVGAYSPASGYWTGSGSIVGGDFNGDGMTDLVHILGDINYPAVDYVNIWTSEGEKTFNVGTYSPAPGYWTGSGSLLSGDFNGDGKSDLVHILGDKNYPSIDFFNIWISSGDGSFQIKTYSPD